MKERFIIQKTEEGRTLFFSARAGRDLGAAGQGWIDDRDQAISFGRQKDAEEFVEIYLPHVGPFCTTLRLVDEEAE